MSDYLRKRERERQLERVRGKAKKGARNGNGDDVTLKLKRAEAPKIYEAMDLAWEALGQSADREREYGEDENAAEYADAQKVLSDCMAKLQPYKKR